MLSLGVAKGAPVVPTSLTSTSGRRGRGRTSRVGGFPPAGLGAIRSCDAPTSVRKAGRAVRKGAKESRRDRPGWEGACGGKPFIA